MPCGKRALPACQGLDPPKKYGFGGHSFYSELCAAIPQTFLRQGTYPSPALSGLGGAGYCTVLYCTVLCCAVLYGSWHIFFSLASCILHATPWMTGPSPSISRYHSPSLSGRPSPRAKAAPKPAASALFGAFPLGRLGEAWWWGGWGLLPLLVQRSTTSTSTLTTVPLRATSAAYSKCSAPEAARTCPFGIPQQDVVPERKLKLVKSPQHSAHAVPPLV